MLLTVSALYAQSPKVEMRAVWITSIFSLDWPQIPHKNAADIEQQKADFEEILDKLKVANFNVVLLQARLRGDVIYPSQFEPQAASIASKNTTSHYDPLSFAIEKCHERGLECHAWLVTYPLGRDAFSTTGQKTKDFVKQHKNEVYLDPGNPNTNKYLLHLVNEIVVKYDIDGIHLDYIRYPDRSFPDNSTFQQYGKGANKADWRTANINQFVYQLYDQVKARKPWVQVSSSVIGKYDHRIEPERHYMTAVDVGQDPEDWLKKGKHDFIVPMMYNKGNLFFPYVDDWQHRGHGRPIVVGLAAYNLDRREGNWTLHDLTAQLDDIRKHKMGGHAFYRLKYLTDNTKGIMNKLVNDYYSSPSLLSPMIWLDATRPLPPHEVEGVREGDFLKLSWEAVKQPNRKKVFYNIYCSPTSPVDTSNAANLLATRVEGSAVLVPIDSTIERGDYYAVTSYDRYHNESEPSVPVYFVTGRFEK
ncbi:hypothetical protein SAMD00024442_21_61 [Candidatus Symbiothrix dinenymphae]|nr:hypothetical protein SAMD00024442_21_61 [Candidatus Symbiothrix dinenymphae]